MPYFCIEHDKPLKFQPYNDRRVRIANEQLATLPYRTYIFMKQKYVTMVRYNVLDEESEHFPIRRISAATFKAECPEAVKQKPQKPPDESKLTKLRQRKRELIRQCQFINLEIEKILTHKEGREGKIQR